MHICNARGLSISVVSWTPHTLRLIVMPVVTDLDDELLELVLFMLDASSLQSAQATSRRLRARAHPLFSSAEWQANAVDLITLVRSKEGLKEAVQLRAKRAWEDRAMRQECDHFKCDGELKEMFEKHLVRVLQMSVLEAVHVARKYREVLLELYKVDFYAALPETKYAAALVQKKPAGIEAGRRVVSLDPSTWKCDETDVVRANPNFEGSDLCPFTLWLNLSTGHIGGGREQYDGSGGTGGALKHYKDTGSQYPLVVKLGSITRYGADVYSYALDENCSVQDPKLSEHLAFWGIDMNNAEATHDSMAEINFNTCERLVIATRRRAYGEKDGGTPWQRVLELAETRSISACPVTPAECEFLGLQHSGPTVRCSRFVT